LTEALTRIDKFLNSSNGTSKAQATINTHA
jgi:hypothetical protein